MHKQYKGTSNVIQIKELLVNQSVFNQVSSKLSLIQFPQITNFFKFEKLQAPVNCN